MLRIFTIALLFTFLLFSSFEGLAQQKFKIPKRVVYKSEEDYHKYQDEILACIDWLDRTPIGLFKSKRKATIKFMMTWVEGAPHIKAPISHEALQYIDENPELMFAYISGRVRYEITEQDYEGGHIEGLRSILLWYTLAISINRDEDIQKLSKKLPKRSEVEL
ncbi:hypothetical protein [Sediminitomix flava]|uniref:Uncharacterized protein n=1 Tax=Sediminitomix flava TaxID=379075 RepID=A0A315ZCI7_SEDFL|nr:hypothetical protein [Sediminitomix flava]PWJ42829.1 hypothetical protein BC781_102375 [Sediminitomix flava]